MSQANSMKQIGSRVVGGSVEHMEWSNKMDLIAYGTDRGKKIMLTNKRDSRNYILAYISQEKL